jgi:hypothetical protein
VRAVDNQKADNQGEGGIDGGTSMTPVTGDGNKEGEAMERGYFQRGRRRGGSTVPESDDTAEPRDDLGGRRQRLVSRY